MKKILLLLVIGLTAAWTIAASTNARGYSWSGIDAATSVNEGQTVVVNLDGDGARTITLAANSTGATIAADINSKVRALTAIVPAKQTSYDYFRCVYHGTQYGLLVPDTSDTATVVVTGGTAAAALKLGVANGGTEGHF